MSNFEGKSVIVTGGTQGLCRAISKAFMERGANVSTCYLNDETKAKEFLEEFTKYSPIVSKADITNLMDIERFRAEVFGRFSKVDILINNAGNSGQASKLQNLSNADFLPTLETNIVGTFNMIKAFAPSMIENKYGRIVNVSSVASKGDYGMSIYAASKAGVEALTKCLAIELGSKGVTVNAIRPAYINSGMLLKHVTEEFRNNLAKKTTLKRLGLEEEVASEVIYLSSEEASYINGQIRDIDGGIF